MADHFTPDHELPLPEDGQIPWGSDYRTAMGILDLAVPFVRAQMWAFDNAQVTVITNSQTYVDVNSPGMVGESPCGCIEFPEPNLMRYVGSQSRVMSVSVSTALQPVGNNKVLRMAISKRPEGGSFQVIEQAQTRVRVGSGGDIKNAVALGIITMDPGDEIKVVVGNWTDTANVTVIDCSVLIRG